MWPRGSSSGHTLCCGPLSVLTLYNWSVSLGKKCPEGLKKPKNGSEEHSCLCLICLPGSHRLEARQKTQPPVGWSRLLLPVHSNPGAGLLWASTQQHESLSTGYACPVDKVTVVCPRLDNPIQSTWTLASELCFRESLPHHRSQQGSRYVTVFTDIFTPACWQDSPLEYWRELSAAPDCTVLLQIRSAIRRESGPMEEGASARPSGQGCRRPSLPPSLKPVLKLP